MQRDLFEYLKKSLFIRKMIAITLIFFLSIVCIKEANKTIESYSNESGVEVYEKIKTNQIRYCTKQVALTFDDGPSSQYTEKLLDGLKEREVKATFFIMGQNIDGNEMIIKRMYKEGHLLGNHTFTHVNLEKVEVGNAIDDINKTTKRIYELTGYKVKYIRPPFGACDDKIKKETNMSVVLWNVDPEDWKDQNKELVAKRIIQNVKNGDIILLHDIFNTSVEAALYVVDELQREGYSFVRVDELSKSDKIK